MDIENSLSVIMPLIQERLGKLRLSLTYNERDRTASFALKHPLGGLLTIHVLRPDIIALNGPDQPARFFLDLVTQKGWP